MIQFGEYRTCDRCKKTEFVAADKNKRVVYDEYTFSGWGNVPLYGDLCSECMKDYYGMMKEFMRNDC